LPYWTIKILTETGSTSAGTIWGLPEAKIKGVTLDT
jgi:hypothetical protein